MDIYTNFYIQAVLCIVAFIPVFFLMRSSDKLKNELEDKIKTEK